MYTKPENSKKNVKALECLHSAYKWNMYTAAPFDLMASQCSVLHIYKDGVF